MGRKKRSRRQAAHGRGTATGGPAGGPGGGSRRARTIALAATAAVVVVGIAAAAAFAVRSSAAVRQDPGPPRLAPEAVARAADAMSFRPSNDGNSDLIERMPADAPLPPPSPTLLAVGSEAPDFTLWTPTGEKVRLADYRGRTVLLEFFATWCPHCQREAKHLVELSKKLPADQFAFLAVNVDSEDAATVLAFDRFYGIPYATLLDPGGLQGDSRRESGPGRVSRQYRVASYPTFYVIGADGRIRWRADREQPDVLILQELTRASER